MSSQRFTMIVLFLPQEWTNYVRRPHWEAISRRTDVLAVEPPVGLLTLWLHPKRFISYLKSGRQARKSAPGLFLWRPLSLASIGLGFRFTLAAKFDRWWIRKQLRPILNSMRKPDQAVATFIVKVQQYYLRDVAPSDLRCYEVTDEYRVYTRDDKLDPADPRAVRMIRREKDILSEADLVIVSSEQLYESRSEQNANTHYLSNCADYAHFSGIVGGTGKTPADLEVIPRPRLGYIGGFNDLIDLELLTRLARERAEASIIFIGEEKGSRRFRQSDLYTGLRSLGNVYFLGHRPYESLPAYLSGFDVCLMPFRCNEWMRNSSPNKTYQYLAAGKPVVSTDFPEIHRVKPAVFVASDHDEFISLVDTALTSDSEEVILQRRKIARANSTDARAEAVIKLIAESLEAGQHHEPYDD